MAKTTTGSAHRHRDSRGKWVTEEQPHTHEYLDTPHAADILTAVEVTALKTLLAAGGGGGTTPIPNPPPGPTPDVTAPTVSGVSASVTTTTATVVATTSEAATVQVEYSTTGVWPGTLTAATSSGTSHSRTLTGLTPGQSYVYRIRATDTAGNLRLDGNRTFTTTAVATLPGAPTGLTAFGGNTQVVLTWAAPASNGGSAITGYRLYRNGASLIVLGVVLTYNNTGLTNGLTYTYTVAAITAVGEGPQSGSAFATPAAGGDINPPIISNVQITNITTTGAQISWSLNEGGTGQVEYGLTTGYGTLSTLEAGYLTGHNQTLSGLLPNKLYHFRVRSADAAGNLALGSDRTFTTVNTTPTPSPGRPFAYPTITAIVNVPNGSNIQALVNAAANGTEFIFAANSSYTIPDGINLGGKHHMVFTGNGTTIRATGSPGTHTDTVFALFGGSQDILIRGFVIDGGNPSGLYNPGAGENLMGVNIFGGFRVEIANCTIRNTWGDGVYIPESVGAGPTYTWSEDVWIHDCTFSGIGRMGIALIALHRGTFERNSFDRMSLDVLDIEPDNDFEGADNIVFQDNSIGSYAHYSGYASHVIALVGHASATVHHITVQRNTVAIGRAVNVNNTAGGFSLRSDGVRRDQYIVVIDNAGTPSGPGPLIKFEHIDHLTYYQNAQAVTSGSLYSVVDCTDIDTTP